MASLNRAAWLPSKVTKLRSGKIEHRPGQGQRRTSGWFKGYQEDRQASQTPWGLEGSWDQASHRVQRSQVKGIHQGRSHSEMRFPTEVWEGTHRSGEEASWGSKKTQRLWPTP